MQIVNLTGHSLRLGYSAEMLASMGKARVRGDMKEVGRVEIIGPPRAELPILLNVEQTIEHLPNPREGVLYVVSGVVASHPLVMLREDVVCPARPERAANGRVTGCHAFMRIRRA